MVSPWAVSKLLCLHQHLHLWKILCNQFLGNKYLRGKALGVVQDHIQAELHYLCYCLHIGKSKPLYRNSWSRCFIDPFSIHKPDLGLLSLALHLNSIMFQIVLCLLEYKYIDWRMVPKASIFTKNYEFQNNTATLIQNQSCSISVLRRQNRDIHWKDSSWRLTAFASQIIVLKM